MKTLDYEFNDPKLFELALTQSGANAAENNERLEFLGDRVLGLAVASMIYRMFPAENEGEMARRHSVLVSTKTLTTVAKRYGFDRTLRHGHMTGGRLEHIAANAMESVIAAIYLDGGWDAALSFILSEWSAIAAAHKTAPKDPKTELQELCQHKNEKKLPEYEYVDCPETGKFQVRASAMGKSAEGIGSTKKAASAVAAEKLLRMVKK